MLLPREKGEIGSNLELMEKGFDAYFKLNLLSTQTEEDPRLKHTLKSTMKTKRSMDEVSTDDSEPKKKKHRKSM